MDCKLEQREDQLWYCMEEDCCWGPMKFYARRTCSFGNSEAHCRNSKPQDIIVEPIVKKITQKNVILILGIHSSLSSCLAVCLEKLGVFMGQKAGGGEADWLLNYCHEKQPFPTLNHIIGEQDVCGGCGGNMNLASWIRLQLHIKSNDDVPVGLKFPTLCAWSDILENVEKINGIKFKILHIDRPLEESITSAIDRTKSQPSWGGKHMLCVPEEERCRQVEILQQHLHKQKNNWLNKRESFRVQSWRLLTQTHIVIRELVNWLKYNFDYQPSQQQIYDAIRFVQPDLSSHSQSSNESDCIKNTTFIIKAFERPEHLNNLLNSIYNKYPNVNVIVGDDSEKPECRSDTTVFHLPYDIGLSAGRNFLVDRVQSPYILLLDDDYVFDDRTDIDGMYDKLLLSKYDVVAGGVDAPRHGINWLGHFKEITNGIVLCRGATEEYKGVKKYEWAPNFFVAKTDVLRKYKWNEELKLAEQLDWFNLIRKNNISLGHWNGSYVGHKTLDWFNGKKNKSHKKDKYYKMRTRASKWIKQCVENNQLRGDECSSSVDALPIILDKINVENLPIPKRLHQIWVGPESMPQAYREYCSLWRSLHPSWDYRLWGDTDAEGLMTKELLSIYNQSYKYAQKADLIRLLAVYYYGGVYLDTDFQPLGKLDDIIKDKKIFVVQATKEGEITNAAFGAVPKHPFILELIKEMPKYWDKDQGNSIGPPMFRDMFNKSKYDIYKFPMGVFYPYEWDERKSQDRFNPERYKNAVAIHHFAASWM